MESPAFLFSSSPPFPLMKIYTRTGDKGQTGLFGGKRVDKSAIRLHAYGTIDELNASLGIVLASNRLSNDLRTQLIKIQSDLFTAGADLATPLESKAKTGRMQQKHIDELEQWIDAMDASLPPLTQFILPGGCAEAAQLHLARTICRRGERWMVELKQSESIGDFALPYINRLSDYLFVAARYINRTLDTPEEAVVIEKI